MFGIYSLARPMKCCVIGGIKISMALMLCVPLTSKADDKEKDKNDVVKDGFKGRVKAVVIRGFKTIDTKDKKENGRLIHTTINRYNDRGFLVESVSSAGIDTVQEEIIRFKSSKITYKYDDHDNMIGSCRYRADGKLEDSSTYKVDEQGNRIDWYMYNAEGGLISNTSSEYNDHGDILESNDYEHGKLQKRHTYKYNTKYKVIEENEYSGDGKLKFKETFKYNAKGQLSEVIDYAESGEFQAKYTYKYDAKGNMTEESKYTDEISPMHSRLITTYDANNNPATMNQYNEENKLIFSAVIDSKGNHTVDVTYSEDGTITDKVTQMFKYNEHGDMTFEQRSITNGHTDLLNIYEFEYDKAGNWTKKTSLENGLYYRTTEREIEYF